MVDAQTGRVIKYAELIVDARRFASGLYDVLGFKKWDVVAVFSPNHTDFLTVLHGALQAGGSVSPANPGYTATELAHQLRDSRAAVLVTTIDLLPTALVACDAVGLSRSRILLMAPPAGVRESSALVTPTRPRQIKFTREELRARPAFLCYSSGTTGLPKAVITTHYNIVASVLMTVGFDKHHGQAVVKDTFAAVLPLYHIYGLYTFGFVAPYLGNRVVVIQKFELESYLRVLQDYEVGTAHIVPPIVLALAKHPIVDNFKFPKLRRLISAAAPLSGDVAELATTRLGIQPQQGYGMTEMSPIGTLPIVRDYKVGSSGRLVPNLEMRVVDPATGRDVGATGREGELWFRGPNIMKGYHNNRAATVGTFDETGQWLRTGDVGYVDAGGSLFIVDRIKELIKYKGLQVAPAELEAVLLTHPGVADAAVIPTPDDRAGELPRAYVVVKPSLSPPSAADLDAYVAARVANHKRLRGGVRFVAEIPKAASGKILRRVLRAREAEERRAAAAAGGDAATTKAKL
ncbi:hypothetical protein DFJ73DRAFT_656943 [Zopfochytrium polystomum]|nr:hypothetical protein DFJ73DRAFT_656943 [Zopfochytrium polystomum]